MSPFCQHGPPLSATPRHETRTCEGEDPQWPEGCGTGAGGRHRCRGLHGLACSSEETHHSSCAMRTHYLTDLSFFSQFKSLCSCQQDLLGMGAAVWANATHRPTTSWSGRPARRPHALNLCLPLHHARFSPTFSHLVLDQDDTLSGRGPGIVLRRANNRHK